MFNQTLSTINIIGLIINVITVCYALYWNFKGIAEGTFRPQMISVVIFLFIYLTGYFILLFSSLETGVWSSYLQFLSPFVWVMVWETF